MEGCDRVGHGLSLHARRRARLTLMSADHGPAVDSTRLRADLTAAGYVVDEVLDRIGTSGQDGLGRNCTVPADVALGGATDPLATLIRVFLLQQPVPAADLRGALDVDALLAAGYLAARLTGKSAEESVRSGARMASVVIQHPGAIIPREAMPEDLM